MVGHEDQRVIFGAEPEQPAAEQRARGEIERLGHFDRAQVPHPPERVGLGGQIGFRQLKARGRVDDLVPDAADSHQPAAQHLVPLDDGVERPAQDADVERAGQAQGRGDVVGGGTRFELIEEPQPLLRERQRQRVVVADRQDRRRHGTGRRRADGGGEVAQRGVLEQHGQRQFPAERLPGTGDRLDGGQRVPAEFEETVVTPDPVDPEDVLPDLRDDLFGRGARRVVRAIVPGTVHAGCGERVAVDLAVRGDQQGGERGVVGGDHVGGQMRGQPVP